MTPERALDLRAKVADYVRCDTDDPVHHAFIELLDGKDTLPGETLTLRDQFAMAALSGTCNEAVNMADVEGAILATALRCYDYADAMLKARKK